MTPPPLTPLPKTFANMAEFVAACPFPTQRDARLYCEDHPQYEYFGLRFEGISLFGVRPKGERTCIPVPPGSVPSDHAPQKRIVPPREPSAPKGTPRYIEVLDMLRAGPISLDDIIARYSCSQAAAAALISDIRRKCGANVVKDGAIFRLDIGTGA